MFSTNTAWSIDMSVSRTVTRVPLFILLAHFPRSREKHVTDKFTGWRLNRGFHVYQYVTSHSHIRSTLTGKAANQPSFLLQIPCYARANMNDCWAKYANVLDPSARECYNKKLERTLMKIYHMVSHSISWYIMVFTMVYLYQNTMVYHALTMVYFHKGYSSHKKSTCGQ